MERNDLKDPALRQRIREEFLEGGVVIELQTDDDGIFADIHYCGLVIGKSPGELLRALADVLDGKD